MSVPVSEEDSEGAHAVEPLWSPVVATGGNQPQIDEARKPPRFDVAKGASPG